MLNRLYFNVTVHLSGGRKHCQVVNFIASYLTVSKLTNHVKDVKFYEHKLIKDAKFYECKLNLLRM